MHQRFCKELFASTTDISGWRELAKREISIEPKSTEATEQRHQREAGSII